MRLIDADEFRKDLCKCWAGYGTHENDTKEDIEWNEDLAWFIEQMDKQPTIEPVAIRWIEDRAEIIYPVFGESIPHDKPQDLANLKTKVEEVPENNWIPFRLREMTAEEQKEHMGEKYMWADPMPDDGQEILVSDGQFVWKDTFMDDGDICYLENNDYITTAMAWMPLPKPYKPKDGNE